MYVCIYVYVYIYIYIQLLLYHNLIISIRFVGTRNVIVPTVDRDSINVLYYMTIIYSKI